MISGSFPFTVGRLSDFAELAKLRLVGLVLFSAAVGFFLGSEGAPDLGLFLLALTGTALVASGSMALNQWAEKDLDSRMIRPAGRPLPSGRVQPVAACVFGILLSGAGIALLYFLVNPASAFLAALTLGTYILLYTPLKTRTSLCTIVGAVPGALPPLIGWSAAAGTPTPAAWILFAVLFLWQMPHFLAIAWLYRADYAAAGFKMLSVTDPDGRQVGRQMLIYSLALLPVSLLPTMAGLTGPAYFIFAFLLGATACALIANSLQRMDKQARFLFRLSIIHLSLLLIGMLADKQ